MLERISMYIFMKMTVFRFDFNGREKRPLKHQWDIKYLNEQMFLLLFKMNITLFFHLHIDILVTKY